MLELCFDSYNKPHEIFAKKELVGNTSKILPAIGSRATQILAHRKSASVWHEKYAI